MAVGNALSFSGVAGVTFATTTPLPSTQSHSFECWIKTSASGSTQVLFFNSKVASGIGSGLYLGTTGLPRFFFQGESDVFDGVTAVNNGVWRHLVASYDSVTRKVKIYIDGSLNATSGVLGTWVGTSSVMLIGAGLNTSDAQRFFLTGIMDEFDIYNIALSAAEVTDHYNAGAGRYGLSGDTGILYGYHADESASPILSYATANNGTVPASVTFVAGKVEQPSVGPSNAVKTGMFFGHR